MATRHLGLTNLRETGGLVVFANQHSLTDVNGR